VNSRLLLAQEVATLVNENKFRLQSGNFVETKKLILRR